MPTFSAIAFDTLLEPGASGSVEHPVSKLDRIKGKPPKERIVSRPQISPALYATPEAIPLPDSPSSFPPSPYIINHKSRGPRLLKSFSEVDVSFRKKPENDENTIEDSDVKASTLKKSTSFTFPTPEEGHTNGIHGNLNGICDGPALDHDGELWNGKLELGSSNGGIGNHITAKGLEKDADLLESVVSKADPNVGSEDFYDLGESVRFTTNTDVEEDAGAESIATPAGEFYDAWDELSVDSGIQICVNDIEAELKDIRLSLVMEIEKRKQAEETLVKMKVHWQRLQEQLGQVGVALPFDPTTFADSQQHSVNVREQIHCQLEIARFVSESIGRGLIKAEVEMDMESKLDAKNFEITRLSDRLHYYEAVNREMSQRNQEVIEVSRRERQRRKKRQRWIWGSIMTTITLGSVALAWSYLPAGKSCNVSEPQPSMKDE